MNEYRALTQDEVVSRGDVDEAYEVLIGPNGFECVLTEPEDRTWHRDGSNVIEELNRLRIALEAKDKELAAVHAELREATQ